MYFEFDPLWDRNTSIIVSMQKNKNGKTHVEPNVTVLLLKTRNFETMLNVSIAKVGSNATDLRTEFIFKTQSF